VEDFVLRLFSKELNLDPKTVAEARLELAERYLAEGKELVDRDPVQASEKLYKVAEECVKALAIHYNLEDILGNVEKRGRWTVTDLEKAVKEISRRVDELFVSLWDHAWVLHVWGFHEAKLDSESVKMRIKYIESMLEKTRKIIGEGHRVE
jgi:AraC-like DNA-binding protein